VTAKIIEARNEIAYQVSQLAAYQRLGSPEVITDSVPKVKRENLAKVSLYITYASAEIVRETRASIKTNPQIDIAIVAPLNDETEERERLAEFYVDCLEQLGRESLNLQLDAWHVATCELLTPTDPERWRNMAMYLGIIRLTVEER
jgi:predicted nucleotidyltransferase